MRPYGMIGLQGCCMWLPVLIPEYKPGTTQETYVQIHMTQSI